MGFYKTLCYSELIKHFFRCFRFRVVFAEPLQTRRSLQVITARRVALRVSTPIFPSSHCRNYTLRCIGCVAARVSRRFVLRVEEWQVRNDLVHFFRHRRTGSLLAFFAIDNHEEVVEERKREGNESRGWRIAKAEAREPDVSLPPTREGWETKENVGKRESV